MSFDLAALKLKTADELEQDEREFLIEHREDLTDEDAQAYASFLPQQEPEPDPEINQEDPAKESEVEPKTQPAKTPPETVAFKSREELDEYLKEKLEASKKDETPEIEEIRIFNENELPKDWNDALGRAVLKAKEETLAEFQKLTKAEKEEVERQKKAYEDTVAGFEAEFKQLSTEGKLPGADTEEFQEARKQIYELGGQYALAKVTDAYNLWSKIPKEHGGGYDPQAQAQADKKAQKQKQKQIASTVGGGSGGDNRASSTPKMDYVKFHNTDLSELLDED
jgi:hypothetical protein